MGRARDAIARDPGLALVVLAALAVIAIYAPSLGYGLTNYDDPWLFTNNTIAREPSLAHVHAIFFDLEPVHRFTLGAEYLPVRDLSVMLDAALWGDAYAGYHATNLALYVAAIALWFRALDAFGVDRKVAGVAILLWALHPAHAESICWLSERKGLLGVMFAGGCAFGYARFRTGGSARWLVAATLAGVCAVWSKAPSAFAIGALAALELLLPARRASWRRSLVGLASIGAFALAAFAPVVMTASRMQVVGDDGNLVAGRAQSVIGIHGFDLQLAAMLRSNAISYPIATQGPTTFDMILGLLGLLAAVVAVAIPRAPRALRVGAALWLFGWLPASHLVLPVHTVVLADRYLLFATLGTSLAIATAAAALRSPATRRALIAAVALAGGVRSIDARSSWANDRDLWTRATDANPSDANAWSQLAEADALAGDPDAALDAATSGLRHVDAPTLHLRVGILRLARGEGALAIAELRLAAEGGDDKAMSNLALLLSRAGQTAEALDWARRAATAAELDANAQRILGKLALEAKLPGEALVAFRRAYRLEPANLANRFNLGLALVATGRAAEARPHFEACADDPRLGAAARAQLDVIH